MAVLSAELDAELRRLIAKHQLEAAGDVIVSNAVECYAMIADGPADDSTIGTTRFGGDPDLPKSMAWPTGDDGPEDPETVFSNFIAQINFAEFPPLSAQSPLPSNGILYLFVGYMDGAGEPVGIDTIFYDGDPAALQRTPVPDEDCLADEYLVDLKPIRIRIEPTLSLSSYRKEFREEVERVTEPIGDKDGDWRRIDLEGDLLRENQIGQVLGFANAGDESDNLYRTLILHRLDPDDGCADYWDSIEEYEAYIDKWRSDGDEKMVEFYEEMRDAVNWFVNNREMLERKTAEWRLLFRLNSNRQMDFFINDADPLYVFAREPQLAAADFSDLGGVVTQG